ncbi:MAG: type II toxin-antitoxin system MqsA family antitoxin [Magnetococcales bacterium]|nr:type II toxin-antitoxin system MqsA family antitoxin [Magnetococcales bacterium]
MAICQFCGRQEITARQVEYLYRRGEQFMVVKEVPCLECGYCGEQYFEAVVLKKIESDFEDIQANRKKPMRTIQVPVEAYLG